VVIPTFNRAGDLRVAIESVLGQGYRPIEVVVVDDGSTDETAAVVGGFGPTVHYVRQENQGVSAARNRGLREVRGEFVAFLDSDDVWLPWKVEAEVAVLRAHPDIGMVWTDMTAVDADGHHLRERYLRTFYHAYRTVRMEEAMPDSARLGDLWHSAPADLAEVPVHEGQLFSAMFHGNLVHTSTVVLRRSWVRQIGGFDEGMRVSGEDYDFHLRTTSLGRVALIDAPSIRYRVGAPDQLTSPRYMVHIARNNLRTIQQVLEASGSGVGLSRTTVHRRLAGALSWLGEEELECGNSAAARRVLARSLLEQPGQARTAAMLGLAMLPTPARRGVRRAARSLLGALRACAAGLGWRSRIHRGPGGEPHRSATREPRNP
jgi:GT2 family glycosyltransferase